MSADQKVELKFKDATDTELEFVKLVTPEIEVEQQLVEEPGRKEAEADNAAAPAQVHHQILSSQSTPDQPLAEPTTVYCHFGAAANEPHRSTVLPDFKQVFNCAYFTAATLASAELVHALDNTMIYALAVMFACFAAGAFVYSVNQRVHISDFSVTLSRRARFAIRAIALLIPIPIILGAACTRMSGHELELAEHAYNANQYNEAIQHLNLATQLNPFSEGAIDGLSRVYFMQVENTKALEFAQKASSMDPKDSWAWTDQARPLRALGRNAEAVVAAERAVQLDANNGQAYSILAELYNDAGKYEMALSAAEKHANFHSTEPYAFEEKATILHRLGRNAEAAAATAEAHRLSQANLPQP